MLGGQSISLKCRLVDQERPVIGGRDHKRQIPAFSVSGLLQVSPYTHGHCPVPGERRQHAAPQCSRRRHINHSSPSREIGKEKDLCHCIILLHKQTHRYSQTEKTGLYTHLMLSVNSKFHPEEKKHTNAKGYMLYFNCKHMLLTTQQNTSDAGLSNVY